MSYRHRTTYIGYEGGRSEAYGPYGHRPWERAFEDEARDRVESQTLRTFQAEWSAMCGPEYRGINCHFSGRDIQTRESDESYQRHLDQDRRERRKPGESARRRRLRRRIARQPMVLTQIHE